MTQIMFAMGGGGEGGALKRCNIWNNVSRVEQEKAQSGGSVVIMRVVQY